MNATKVKFLNELRRLLLKYEAEIEASVDSWDNAEIVIEVKKPQYTWADFSKLIDIKTIDEVIRKEIDT